jgi:hypothetical protein
LCSPAGGGATGGASLYNPSHSVFLQLLAIWSVTKQLRKKCKLVRKETEIKKTQKAKADESPCVTYNTSTISAVVKKRFRHSGHIISDMKSIVPEWLILLLHVDSIMFAW